MTAKIPSYDELFAGAINAATVAGEILASVPPDEEQARREAYEVAQVVLQGGQIFATLALAQATRGTVA